MYQLNSFKFPKDFKFGAAEADLQVIGEQNTLDLEKSQPTMWLNFSQTSPDVYKNQTPLAGIDRYHRWQEDIELMQQLGLKHYRTSVSMARVMTVDKKPNKKAIEWYQKYFSALTKAGISVYITIYHWELPHALSKRGGWKNREIVDYLVEHAKIIHQYLGEYITEYFILNEPVQATFYSYHQGEQAPGERNLQGALASIHHMLLAQGKVYRALRKLDKNIKLSTVYNPSVTYALTSNPKDLQAARYCYGYHTAMFTDPLYLGTYPDYMTELFGKRMPHIESDDMETICIGNGLHSFGVNYYRAKTVQYDPNSEIKFAEVRFAHGVKNGMGRPIYIPPTYPEGLCDLLCELYHRYENYGMKRMYITENGTSWPDTVSNGKINDEFRIFYLREHLQQVQKAILKGVPIEGYFVWALMDNYNWSAGYRSESVYGLIHVDFLTQKRILKKSFYWYQNLIKTHSLQ